ncbi:hypothetical protein JL720_10318 [Aureococcus anophagefferens]|nr:hypothetical protein JL720_10318 [Aureococcus anophagefferens]
MVVGLALSGGGVTACVCALCLLDALGPLGPDVVVSTVSGGTLGYLLHVNAPRFKNLTYPETGPNATYESLREARANDGEACLMNAASFSSAFWAAAIVESGAEYALLKDELITLPSAAGDDAIVLDGGMVDTTGIAALLRRQATTVAAFTTTTTAASRRSRRRWPIYLARPAPRLMNAVAGPDVLAVFDGALWPAALANLTAALALRGVRVAANAYLGVEAYHVVASLNAKCDAAHFSPIFVVWHRAFELQFENALLAVNGNISGAPYWDYRPDADDPGRAGGVFTDHYFGDWVGQGPGFEVTNGRFADWPVAAAATAPRAGGASTAGCAGP